MLSGKVKGVASFLCAACLWAQVGANEIDFGKVVEQDQAVSDFSTKSVDYVFSTSAGSTVITSPGDLMIDFVGIYQPYSCQPSPATDFLPRLG